MVKLSKLKRIQSVCTEKERKRERERKNREKKREKEREKTEEKQSFFSFFFKKMNSLANPTVRGIQ